jgi:LmbE family N-acetylglucosaminyl deacetylase
MSNATEATHRRILAFGAHPDDLEFGCGGILLQAAKEGAQITLCLCSRGESGSNGTAEIREAEARKAAQLLKAEIQFLDLGGDGLIENTRANALLIAQEIRRQQPTTVLAPTLTENQHPDHAAVGALVRDAARLARYGGLDALSEQPLHTIEELFYYAISPGAEPAGVEAIRFDISDHAEAWTALMACHASQMKTRRYIDLQLARARMHGLSAGVEAAQLLFPNDPLLLSSWAQLPSSTRLF